MSKERLEEIAYNVGISLDGDKALMSSDDYDFLYNYALEQAERVEKLEKENKRYREALEEIMKIQENHEWNLYGIAYGIAEKTLFEVEGEE